MKMLLNWAVFVIGVLSCCSGSNTTVEYKYDDICSNECDDNDSSHWCGQRRMDGEGKISRCVQYTRYGDPCVTSCLDEKDETYKWCRTNAVQHNNQAEEWWEYCSLEGFTINKEKCLDECTMRDKDYYWCHTNKDNKWDYCSPSPNVKPVQLTTKGGQCKTQCEHHYGDYFWCTRNIEFCGKICEEKWAYCSLDDMHTTKGKECKEKCSMAGADYYWCNTLDGGWDYCSPIAKAGVHLSLEIELDVYGNECRNLCSMQGEDYFWCKQIGGRGSSWWDYCSPQNMTRYNSPCSDQCERRGEEYFWCHTGNSWDYCSPSIHSPHSGAQKKFWPFALVMFALLSCKSVL